jgi:excisionase family DNA binding protein
VEPVAVDLKTAARALDVSERTLRRLVAAGRLKASRAGRRRLISTTELQRFLEESAA